MNQQTASPEPLGHVVVETATAFAGALAVGACLWVPMLFLVHPAEGQSSSPMRLRLLCMAMSNQAGFAVIAFWLWSRGKMPKTGIISKRRAIVVGVGVALVAVFLGLVYDEALRRLAGQGTPTLGPWGVLRELSPLTAAILMVVGVFLGPAADEFFFRAGIYGRWADAGRPFGGFVFSTLAFAFSRFDVVNLPAYLVLGCLLCAAYRQTRTILASFTAHAVLNATMFACLYSGYQ